MLDLSDLTAFAHIAEFGGISAAARSLRLPKSSISRSLTRLEASLGAGLVVRSTRHVKLTDAGIVLLQHARRILDDVADAESSLAALSAVPQGELRVSVPFTFAAGPLAEMLPEFIARYPKVSLNVAVDNRFSDLRMENFDVAIRIGALQDSDLIARRLTGFQIWTCASPSYLSKLEASISRPSDLLSHTLIAHASNREVWHYKDPQGCEDDITIESRVVLCEPAVVKGMLMAATGIGRLPDFHARAMIENGSLVRLLPTYDGCTFDAYAMYPSHRRLSSKVRVFIDALVAYFARSESL